MLLGKCNTLPSKYRQVDQIGITHPFIGVPNDLKKMSFGTPIKFLPNNIGTISACAWDLRDWHKKTPTFAEVFV
jgi:hypothetical protein